MKVPPPGLEEGPVVDDDIFFFGDETPAEKVRKYLEHFRPEQRPVLSECAACRRDCKQRKATDAEIIFFTCVDREPGIPNNNTCL